MVTILSIISGLIGLAVLIVKWRMSPAATEDRLRKELAAVEKKIAAIEKERDEALIKDDSDVITRTSHDFVGLCESKKYLLQRIGKGSGG